MPPSSGDRGANRPKAALDALLSGSAGHPLRRALWLDDLDRCLRPLLPPALAAHARLANVDGDRLVFIVDSPVWHAKVRLMSGPLVDAARSIGLEVTRVIVKTSTLPTPRPARELPVKPLSAASQRSLLEALASLREPEGQPAGDES